MASMKRGATIASTLLLASIMLSACNQAYSQQPVVTNTPIDQKSLFTTPLGEPTLSDVKKFGTQTAIAAGTVEPATQTPLGVTPLGNETQTPTPLVELNATNTPTATLAVSGPTATPIPAGTHPNEYILKEGEWPFCIARRFDVDPEALLRASGLVSPDIYYAGLKLIIPQSGGAFPGPRVLVSHPTTYTVLAGDTLGSLACKFGDLYPDAIAQANGISVNSALSAGQTLSIP